MKMKFLSTLLGCFFISLTVFAQDKFNGIESNMGNIFRMSEAKSRSITPENFTGEKGKGGMAKVGTGPGIEGRGFEQGWKVNPRVEIQPHTTFTMAEIDGSGSIQHIWLTPLGNWRNSILRFYWDGETNPSVEVPVGDFFCMGWGKYWDEYAPLSSLAVTVSPTAGFNCYWPMPFRKKCKITMENMDDEELVLYYQVDYILTEVPSDAAYFHAQFRRVNPNPYKTVYTLLDNVKGRGQYVGTYMAWGALTNGWWGEGEMKFYMDGDKDFATIVGTGVEDYFGGSYDFDTRKKNAAGVSEVNYTEFCTPYAGLHQVIRGDGHYNISQRFGMYRWHITDPIRFEKDLKVTVQSLGWGNRHRQDDIATTVFWYQTEPHNPFPALPNKDVLEVY
jgi:hypothetical protein